MKLVYPGPLLSRFLARSVPGGEYDAQYLVKATGKALEVPNLKFRKQVAIFLGDCDSIEQKLEAKKLGKNSLNLVVDEYHRCIENQTKVAFAESIDPRLIAIGELRNKVEGNHSFLSRNDALDVLNDMHDKIKENKKVPNYLAESLRSVFKGTQEYEADVEMILKLLGSKSD